MVLLERARLTLDEREAEWAKLAAALLSLLGNTTTILPLGDQTHDTGLVLTTIGSEQVDFTYSERIYAWDTPPRFLGPLGIPILEFNAVDEEADTPDIGYFSRDDFGGANGLSIGVWANVTDTATARIMVSKWDDSGGAELREWEFYINSSDLLTFGTADESVNVFPNRRSDAAITMGELRFFVVTYNGAGGGSNMNGATLYDNGTVLASTANNEGTYDGMEDLGVQPAIGRIFGSGLFFSGSMTGGPLGPFFTQIELTADQVLRAYQLGRAALGI